MMRRAFTLIELLVAIGIIVLLSTIALASTRSLGGSLRYSTAVNTATASLETARAEAIRRGRPVMAVFRPTVTATTDKNGDGFINESDIDRQSKFAIEIVFAEWTGETTGIGSYVIDRWVPITDLRSQQLPTGMSVATPQFFRFNSSGGGDNSGDDDWVMPTDFVAGVNDYEGELPAIMFDSTGALLEDNPNSPALGPWIDWDNDRQIEKNGQVFSINPQTGLFPDFGYVSMYYQRRLDDDMFASVASYLAVFDLDGARQSNTEGQCTQFFVLGQPCNGPADSREPSYVQLNGKILHLNRFSGAVMK